MNTHLSMFFLKNFKVIIIIRYGDKEVKQDSKHIYTGPALEFFPLRAIHYLPPQHQPQINF